MKTTITAAQNTANTNITSLHKNNAETELVRALGLFPYILLFSNHDQRAIRVASNNFPILNHLITICEKMDLNNFDTTKSLLTGFLVEQEFLFSLGKNVSLSFRP